MANSILETTDSMKNLTINKLLDKFVNHLMKLLFKNKEVRGKCLECWRIKLSHHSLP